ncbi:hypothetical protein COB72_04810 [bacterium]|nr:MAG: hypothetical protein COB72_04810 [bacterium]
MHKRFGCFYNDVIMKLSVLIPTYRRPEAINTCLALLAKQSYRGQFEIIIGLDGDAEVTPDPNVPESLLDSTRLVRFAKVGLLSIRKAMLEQAQGEIVLSINDDSYADSELVDAHMDLHRSGNAKVVSGVSTWKPIDTPNLFDLFVQQSNLLFFAPESVTQPVLTDYRNCFGLNMSFPKKLALEAGGFPEMPGCYGYEDIEIAYRLAQAGAELWHAPGAKVVHDHRYVPSDVLRREYLLGRSAWQFAKLNPAFALDLFRRDIRLAEVLGYFSQALEFEYRDAVRVEETFLALSEMEPDGYDFADRQTQRLFEEHWVLLKRYLWRWGVLDAANGQESRWSLVQELGSPPVIIG